MEILRGKLPEKLRRQSGRACTICFRHSQCYGLLTCQGTLLNQSHTMITSKEPPGKSKRTKTGKRLFSKEKAVLALFFLRGYGRDLKYSGLLTCQGILWNQSGALRI